VVMGRRGGGGVRVEEQAVEGKDPMRRPVVSTREKRHCAGARKGSHVIVEMKVLCFRWLSPFFKYV
jgi:hypothetical protein